MDDSQIINLYLRRSEEAIEETKIKYGAYINQIAYNILRDSRDTEEIVSDTLFGVWNSIPPTKPNSLKHYLSRIVRNISYTRLEYNLAGKRNSLLVELDECIPDEHSDIWDELEAKEIGVILNGFLSGLDSRSCAIFLARYYYSYAIKEIASDYSLSQRQVKYRLSKIRNNLREYFKKEGVILWKVKNSMKDLDILTINIWI